MKSSLIKRETSRGMEKAGDVQVERMGLVDNSRRTGCYTVRNENGREQCAIIS